MRVEGKYIPKHSGYFMKNLQKLILKKEAQIKKGGETLPAVEKIIP